MTPKTVFFCGHKSPYGLAHLRPLIEEFDVKAVVIATEERWKIFEHSLGGKVYYQQPRYYYGFSLANSFPARIINLLSANRKLYYVQRTLWSKPIELWRFSDVNSEDAIQRLKQLDIDLFVSAAYPQIFSKSLIGVPKLGAVNFHPSLLPKYRGAHPHFWQIVKGEGIGGVTAHFMTEEIDDGDIIAQVSFPIGECNYSQLYEKIISHTHQLVKEVRRFFQKELSFAIPQRSDDATYFRNDRDIHAKIFWNIHTSLEIHNLIRTGKAYCFLRGKKVVFASSYVTESNRNLTNRVRVENGTIVDIGKDSVSVKTVDGCINIKEIRENRGKISYLKWAKKMRLCIGEKFD